MKKVFLTVSTLTLMTFNAYALVNMRCEEVVGPTNKHRAVILQQTEPGSFVSNTSKKFKLMVIDTKLHDDALHVIEQAKGTATIGDVDFSFVSDDGKIGFDTYSDEEESGRLFKSGTLNGKFSCEVESE